MTLTTFIPPADSALIVVDVQNDFCPGGSLAVKHGDQVVRPLNTLITRFKNARRPVIFTRDWHPAACEHFKKWPPHCVQGTPGADFHPALSVPASATVITKGDDPIGDAYSGFEGHTEDGTVLQDLLKALGAQTLFIGGLATDYCVKATVLDGLRHGFEVTYLPFCSRPVNLKPTDEDEAEWAMERAGARMLIG